MSGATMRDEIAKAIWDAYTGYVTRIPWDQAGHFKREGTLRSADAVISMPGYAIVPSALLDQAADLIEAWGHIDDWETALEVIASLRDAAKGGE